MSIINLALPLMTLREEVRGMTLSAGVGKSHPPAGANPRRALIVVEETVLAQLVSMTLNHVGYVALAVANPRDALTGLREWRPDLLVVDLAAAGIEFISQVRTHVGVTGALPIIALTRRGDLPTKLAAFEQGVDDILTVPFSPEEFLARVLALLRRISRTSPPFTPVLRLSDLEINVLRRSVRVGGREVTLTPLEQSLLYLLAANEGRVMRRDEILDYLWGTEFAADSNIVDQHIRHLRARLQNGGRRPRFIQTVHGEGYRFVPPVGDAESTSGRV